MEQLLGLRCTICGATYAVDEVTYVCPQHGSEGTLDVVYDYQEVGRRLEAFRAAEPQRWSMWRYLPLLPLEPVSTLGLIAGTTVESVGWTPLVRAPRLAARLGLRQLWVKDDGRQPTASFKDRASAVAAVKAHAEGYEVVTTASTGNAAAALAGMCAALDQRCVIFVPRTAPEAKVAQLMVYGATVLLVDGTYDEAFELCLAAAPTFGWYNRNTGYNPYMSEGKKTAALELCEQLSGCADPPWQAPEVVVVPVGDGCIIGGMHKGFGDLKALGYIERVPRLIGVQAAGSSPLVDAWERGIAPTAMQPIAAQTVADSICAGLPRDRVKAMRAVRESGGAYVRVSDQSILAAIPELARGCGVFAEPAAAAAYAGLARAVELGLVDRDESTVVLATGSGLKDVAAAVRTMPRPPVIAPQLADVRRALAGRGV
ncbi:MAG: threonine synthase [Anaerolineae bacterium]|nr:threonine synthase [Anaerolineae bacterium]